MNKAASKVLQEVTDKLVELNEEYVPRFFNESHEREEVVGDSSTIPILDKNNTTKYGLDYYDLMIANILLRRHDEIKYELSANFAEIITRIAYEGLRHMRIFDDKTAYDFCNDIALHRIPKSTWVYQYLNFVVRYPHNALPYWFYYTLLLWAFVDTPVFNNVTYRSRLYVGIIYNCGLTKFQSYEADRTHDVFDLKDKLSRLIISCIRDKRYEKNDNFIPYMVDSLRVFSIIILSTIISRGCKWDVFCKLGSQVISQRLKEHQQVIDTSYRSLTNKGV